MSSILELPVPVTNARSLPAKKPFLPSFLFLILLLALGLAAPAGVLAQGTTGSITGTVTDATGATIAGANVTVKELETNAVHTVQTTSIGSYTIPQLPPGHYSVTVDRTGFKGFQQQDLTLSIGQVAQINAALEVGSEQQTVIVTSTEPVIQTEDSSVGLVIDSQTIQNTPLNGRLSIMGLIALAPGVQGAGAQDQVPVYGVTPSIGTGSRNSYGGVGYTLDGVTNMSVTLERGEGEVPPLDALSEFKVLTTGAPAEFNQPAQVIVATQSGTNLLHGELLEFNRSKGTQAKYFFAGASQRPAYERNEYGGNVSGPIVLPKLYNGKDRSFFFFSFEGFRLNQASSVNSQQPSVAERSGDFSSFLVNGGCSSVPGTPTYGGTCIYNPTTGLPFANNMIPSSMFNAVDMKLQNILMPLPTLPGTGVNTQELVPYTSIATRFSVRIDHKLGEKNQIRGTFLRAFYGPNPSVGADSKAGGMSGIGEHNTNFIVGWTHTFSSTLLIDTVGSFFHLPVYRTPQNYNVDFSSIIPGLGTEFIEGAPQISITNVTGISEAGSKDLEQIIQARTAITKVLPRHTLKFGGGYLYDNHWNDAAVGPQRGSYSFNGQFTRAPSTVTGMTTGIAFADFLLGDPSSTAKPTPNNYITRNLSSQYSAFIQDDYKATSKFTVNAGIRYDLQWFENNPYGNNSLYVPSLQKIVVFGNSLPSTAIPGFLSLPIVLSSQVGLPTSYWSYLGQPKKDFAPRLGFAYQPFTNTVVRGAFGIFFNLLPASYVDTGFANLPFEGSQTFSQPAGTVPAFNMNAPFSATGAFAANPSVAAEHHIETPYTEEYNLTVEHQLQKGLDLRIGYVGQRNIKQNNASGSGTTAPNINLANPPQVGVTVQSTNLVQPFSTISLNLDPIFHSSMNSLQVGVHKQYSHGVMVSAEYQWTRVLGTENIENPSGANVQDSYGNVGGITPQVLELSYSYLLPVGKGKMFFGATNPVVDKLIGGWQISGITNYQSGQPFSVGYTAPGTVGLVSGRANLVSGVPLYPSQKTRFQWFNPAAFVAPPTYTANGNTYATYGNSAYNMLRGPHYQQWDMTLEKNTIFRERYRVQLRADSFNVLNHPNFNTPNASISNTSTVGTITGQNGEPRTIEFALKFNF